MTIETNKPDWNAIRAEYIGGGIGQRALARKYGISPNTLVKRANSEKWAEQRNGVYNVATIAIQRKNANAAANNATRAERIREKLLAILEREVDALPKSIGSEMYQSITDMTYGGKNGGRLTKRTDGGKKYKLTDLTRAYRDLTDDRKLDVNLTMSGFDALNEAFEALGGDDKP